MEISKKKSIIAYPSHYEITNYNLGNIPRLEDDMTAISIGKFGKANCEKLFQYDNKNKILYVHRGYPRSLLEIGVSSDITNSLNINGYRKVTFNMKLSPRNPEQSKAIRYLLGSHEFHFNANEPQKVLIMPGGTGKTYCAIAALSQMQVPALIITHNTEIRNQWEQRLLDYTNIPKSSIITLSSGSMLKSYLKKTRAIINKIQNETIYLISHSLLTSYINKNGGEELNEIMKILGIGVKIIDECHLAFESTLRIDNALNIANTFYLTATFNRSDLAEDKVFQRLFIDVVKLNTNVSGETPELIYITDPISTDANSLIEASLNIKYQGRDVLSSVKYSDYEFSKPNMLNGIKRWVSYYLEKINDGMILIITPKISSCELVSNALSNKFKDLKVGFHVSGHKLDDLNEYDIICATDKMVGTGTDLPELVMIVNCEPMVSKPNTNQLIRRLTRGNAVDRRRYYIEVIDISIRGVVSRYKRRYRTVRGLVDKTIVYNPDNIPNVESKLGLKKEY